MSERDTERLVDGGAPAKRGGNGRVAAQVREAARADAGQARDEAAQTAPRTVEEARRRIEETRGHIARTIGTIEAQLQARKQELKEKLDVASRVRERVRRDPWPSLGIAVAAGLVLGVLTGSRRRGLSRHDRELLGSWLRAQAEELDD